MDGALKGFSTPFSPMGRSGVVGSPPWHYVGDAIVIEAWAAAEACAAILPEPLRPHPDAGRMAAMFLEWQSCSDARDELLDPSRSQYREFLVTINALLDDREVCYCPYIWVDQDFALERGRFMGLPKKLGSVRMTRTFGLDVPADPGLRAGARFAATFAAYDRRLAEGMVTLERTSSTGPTHINAPVAGLRHFPGLAPGRDVAPINELVIASQWDSKVSPIWEGAATLDFFDAPHDELSALAPLRIGKGFRYSLAWTSGEVEVLRQL